MPIIKLPDGNSLNFPNKISGLEIAEKILTAELDDKSKQEALVNNLVEDVNLN